MYPQYFLLPFSFTGFHVQEQVAIPVIPYTKKENLHNNTTQIPEICAQAITQEFRPDLRYTLILLKMTATHFAHKHRQRKWFIKIYIQVYWHI